MKKIAVVILNWNGKRLLEEFLPSVCANSSEELAEIVVVDNGSDDDSKEFLLGSFPQVRLISLSRNYGFAEGYNRGLAQLENPYAVLLNSDVEPAPGWLEPMYDYCERHADVAACQPKIKSYRNRAYFEHAGAAGGYIDRYGYPFCRGRIFDEVEQDCGQYNEVSDIFWASGAALFIRLSDYKAAGGLDKDFFAHMEEIDLCWRILLTGKRIVYIPESEVFHLGGATLSAGNPRKTYLNFRNNLFLLYKNMPLKDSRSVLFIRRLMDTAAMAKFLAAGHWKDVKAVWKAHMDFREGKKRYTAQPGKNLLSSYPETGRNITADFFLRGKKTF